MKVSKHSSPIRDDALEDEQREYRYAQQRHNRNSEAPFAKDGKVARYYKFYDDDGHMCDAVWVDRTTGERVMRYDAADPASTNPWYGATSDGDYLAKKGCNINEMVSPSEVKFTDSELRLKHSKGGGRR